MLKSPDIVLQRKGAQQPYQTHSTSRSCSEDALSILHHFKFLQAPNFNDKSLWIEISITASTHLPDKYKLPYWLTHLTPGRAVALSYSNPSTYLKQKENVVSLEISTKNLILKKYQCYQKILNQPKISAQKSHINRKCQIYQKVLY